jgi:hypothetical protein
VQKIFYAFVKAFFGAIRIFRTGMLSDVFDNCAYRTVPYTAYSIKFREIVEVYSSQKIYRVMDPEPNQENSEHDKTLT